MYSYHEASLLRKEFWTTFGQYMAPLLSSQEEKINWINYKTGQKNIFFRMHADNKLAFIALEFTHSDVEIQEIYFRHLKCFAKQLPGGLPNDWIWQLHTHDKKGMKISRLYTEIKNVNILNKQDWPSLISFFKKQAITLDRFWNEAKYSLEALQ